MSVTPERVISALNLDESDDLSLLPLYLKSANTYVINAIGKEIEGYPFYTLEEVESEFETAVIALTGTYYTYRIAVTDTQSYQMDYTLNSIVGQLRGLYASYLEEVENGQAVSTV